MRQEHFALFIMGMVQAITLNYAIRVFFRWKSTEGKIQLLLELVEDVTTAQTIENELLRKRLEAWQTQDLQEKPLSPL